MFKYFKKSIHFLFKIIIMKKIVFCLLVVSLCFSCTPDEDSTPDLSLNSPKNDPKPKLIYEDPIEIEPG
tara:strand:+ start:5768 stop:5974 length:207 start_codon:yes stop_codon:yes gene_type:complete